MSELVQLQSTDWGCRNIAFKQ